MLNISTSNRKSSLLKWGKEKLNLKTEGEFFVFKCIIEHHMSDYIVRYIEKIKLECGLISVVMTTSKGSYSFSVSDIKSDGFTDMNDYAKKSYVSNDISHKTVYR